MRIIFLLLLAAFLGPIAFAQLPPYVAQGFPAEDPGYYFITTLDFSGVNNGNSQAVILDGAGQVAFRQRLANVSNFRAWPDGRMSYSARGKHILIDSTFAPIDSVSCANGIPNDLHELRILENGHYALLGLENVAMDLSGYPVFQHGTASGSANAIVKSVVIQELNVAKELVWQWRAIDHFDFLDTDTSRLNNPNVVDWTHSNAIEVDNDGNYLLSSRHFSEITKIDRQADTVIWRMGGVRNEFTFTNGPAFIWQHDIRRLPNGNISLFDNSKPDAHPGRAVEYVLDESALTVSEEWSYAYDTGAYSVAMGNAQRLGNGNTLIGWGALSPDNAMFTVVDPDGTPVSELYFEDTLSSYRSYYFEELPFTIDRPQIACAIQGAMFELTAIHANSGFRWSTGELGPSILVAATDTIHVEVPTGSGGFLRSVPIVPVECASVGMTDLEHGSPVVFPNPAGSVVHLAFGSDSRPKNVELFDVLGKRLWSSVAAGGTTDVPLTDLREGVYLLRVDGKTYRFVKRDGVN
jgi:hypothetical protein